MLSSRDPMKRKAPKDSLTLLPCFYFVELPIVASSMVSLYFLELTDVLQPAQVGFRCHDRALSMPYVDGGDELIPLLMLLSLAFAGPAASIMLGEGLIYCMQSRLKIRQQRAAEGSINAGGCNFNSFLRRTVRFVGVHVFGLCATALLTDVIQLSTGYHAPFFLTVCRPNYTLAPVSCDQNPYITKDICAGPDHNAILAARKTFPSQHATLSAFAAVYISMYFNSTISDSTKLLKPVLVFGFSMVAALTGLTQITQYRSHPADVYVGFLIGGFIAAYLAFHAVANFRSSEDFPPAPAPPPAKEDPLRALTQRGHDSVYNKGPASASDSNDEITVGPVSPPQAPRERLEGLVLHGRGEGRLEGLVLHGREKDAMETLKRSSVDVELLAPRSPMGKEMMVTFSNTLPRASINVNGMLGGADAGEEPPQHPAHLSHSTQPVQRRLKAVQVPMDPLRAQQLVSEWKQKSMEMRGVELERRSMDMRGGVELERRSMEMRGGVEAEREASEEGSEVGSSSLGTDDGGGSSLSSQVPVYPPTVQPARRCATPPACNAQQQPGGGARAVATPRPPQIIPEAGPPPVSPKSALTRAKWLAITEKTTAAGRGGAGGQATNQPRLMQVIAMSKQQGLLPSSPTDSNPKPSDSASSPFSSSGGGGGVVAGRTSPAYVTVDAHHAHSHPHHHHAHHHHHPVVQAPPPPPPPHHSVTPPPLSCPSPSTANGNPWEWRGSVSPAPNGSGGGGDRDPRDTYDLNTHTRGDSAARGSSFRPHSQPSFHHHHHHHHGGSASPEAELQLPPPPLLPPQHGGGGALDLAVGGGDDASSVQQHHHHHHHHQRSSGAARESASVRRKTALVLLDRELETQDGYYKKVHASAGRRYNN